ncbi:MAG: PadR family transcriptional regulator [Spirochaetes bacterium]|nr:PadR family transcriptional regulator [Spirochaetota bacterium]
MEETDILIGKWRTQSRKGFLDLCVLVLLAGKGPSYGLDMMESLNGAGLGVSEGTLYPLLMRMTREESLAASWTTPDSGHPRKYYRITGQGGYLLSGMKTEYEKNAAAYRRLEGGTR